MVGGHVEGGGLGEEARVEGSRRGGDAAGGEDRGDDVDEVLEFVEVGGCGVAGFVEGVEQVGVVGAEAEFVDLVAEVEGFVAEVLLAAEFHVSVAAGGDVEVSLNFVAFEGSVDAAGVGCFPAVEFGCFLELFRWVGPHMA